MSSMHITGLISFNLAIFTGKIIACLSKLFPFIGGTALPGLIALKIDPQLIKKFHQSNQLKSIIITGTNGKTTTSHLTSHILTTAGKKFIHNKTGSNLLRGIASVLITNASFFGKLSVNLALWEIDEAVLPSAVNQLKPKIVLFTNLFRDQLDRYGEINTVLKNWQQAVAKLPQSSHLIINLDDPSLNFLSRSFKHKPNISTFSLSQQLSTRQTPLHGSDALFCPKCLAPLNFTHIFTSHLSHYHCSKCSFKHTKPQFTLKPTSKKSQYTINSLPVKFHLPGIYNLYNLLSAVSLAQTLNIPQHIIQTAVKDFQPAFGRAEEFKIKNKQTKILLVKNPAGFNAVLEMLAKKKHLLTQPLLIAINDLTADGKDVSWLWDVNFELLKSRQSPVIITGLRAYDMALRLKYAGLNQKYIITLPSLKKALKQLKKSSSQPIYILPTYTAMLNIRKILKQQHLN